MIPIHFYRNRYIDKKIVERAGGKRRQKHILTYINRKIIVREQGGFFFPK